MPSADLSWFNFWELVGEWGFVFVIAGVAGEGIEIFIKLFRPKLYNRKKSCLDIIGAIFWIILVVALAVEFLGNFKAIQIAGRINAELHATASQAEKEAGQANERASTNELAAKQLEIQLTETKTELANAETRLVQIKNAIPPRQIPEKQRELFISTLLQTNALSSPKIDIKVFVQDVDDPEAKNFANFIRQMLNDAGYGTNGEEVIKIQPFNVAGGKNERMPQVFAVFATDNNGNKIPLSMPTMGGSLMPFYPTKATVQTELTNSQIPIANYYSNNPNDILGGVRNILNYIGISTAELYGVNFLKPYEVGFYIPPQAE
jgi:hypothetical protein